jgi:tetratricopeptide (TPR) repeat protein
VSLRTEATLRHAEFYSRLLARLGDRQIAGEDVLAELDIEWDQILAAHAAAAELVDKEERAARVVSAMADPRVLLRYKFGPRRRLAWLEAAHAAAAAIGDNLMLLQHFRAMGLAHTELGDPLRALEHHRRALDVATALEIKVVVAEESDYAAVALSHLNEDAAAEEAWERSIELMQELENRDGEGIARLNFGAHQWKRGRTDVALPLFERSAELLLAVSPHKATDALGHQAGVLSELGRHDEGIGVAERAVALARQLNDRLGEARQLLGLGGVLRLAGRLEEALDRFEEAARIAADSGDASTHQTALHFAGLTRSGMSVAGAAVDTATQRLAAARGTGELGDEYAALLALGDAYAEEGRQQDAAETFEQVRALASFRRQNASGAVIRLHRIAAVEALQRLAGLHEPWPARQAALLKQALDTLEDDQRRHIRQQILSDLGIALFRIGDLDGAIAAQQERIAISRAMRDRAAEADAIGEIGTVLTQLRRFDEAVQRYSEALAIDREIGNVADEMNVLANLVAPLLELHRMRDALDAAERAMDIARSRGDREAEGWIGWGLAQTWYMSGRPDLAVSHGERACDVLDEFGVPLGRQARSVVRAWRSELPASLR